MVTAHCIAVPISPAAQQLVEQRDTTLGFSRCGCRLVNACRWITNQIAVGEKLVDRGEGLSQAALVAV